MKVFIIHNKYRYYGGEDSVVDEETKLLKSNNHEVIQLIRNNSEELKSFNSKLNTFKNISYSNESIEILNEKVSKFGLPDIVHVHNTFPLWTYSVLDFFKKKNIPIIMTLHNYRLIWEKLGFLNKNRKNYGFFKDSNILSYFISKLTNKRKDLLSYVTKFITHTEFTRQEFSTVILSSNKLIIKPNFLHTTLNTIKPIEDKKNVIFASRISKEKGIFTLIKTFRNIDISLDILGDGPLLDKIKKKDFDNIKFHGNLSRNQVSNFINKSKFLVFPSEWYESFPMTILEAFREGTLVLASNIGSIKSIIKDKYNGILFNSGDSFDLKKKIEWILANPKECNKIVSNAYHEFNKKYSSETNYRQLIKIYFDAIKNYEN